MSSTLVTSLRRAIAGRVCPTPHWPFIPLDVSRRAWKLVLEQDLRKDASAGTGENKRHRVYAQLLKEYPMLPKRLLAAAIEQAVWKV